MDLPKFWPRNPYGHSALSHTGRFNVKHAVHIQQLRHDHLNSKYCYKVPLHSQICLTVCLPASQHLHLVHVKAIIPVGEPGLPIAATSRRHDCSLPIGPEYGILGSS